MKKQLIGWVTVGSLMVGSLAYAQGGQSDGGSGTTTTPSTTGKQTYSTGEMVSPKLAVAGLITTLVGVAMMLPQGDEYHILGDTYCVSYSGRDVNYGGCGNPISVVKAGAIAAGVGVTMMVIGMQSKTFTIAPQVSPTSKSVMAVFRWGGSHGNR